MEPSPPPPYCSLNGSTTSSQSLPVLQVSGVVKRCGIRQIVIGDREGKEEGQIIHRYTPPLRRSCCPTTVIVSPSGKH
ncbi:hypothetical protein SESBI_49042 [Sesbania bispinosa]|nr:hypothetical protein SESBI_49042 [Sesbania bispinosa]